MKNNKVIAILVAISIIVLAFSVLNTTSAINVKSIDKNSGMNIVKCMESNFNPISYFLNIFKPKNIEEIDSDDIFDQSKKYNNNDNISASWIEWTARLYSNSSVHYSSTFYSKEGIPLSGGGQIIIIEKVANNKLKITSQQHGTPPGSESIEIVNTNYTPKQYFLNVIKKEKGFPY